MFGFATLSLLILISPVSAGNVLRIENAAAVEGQEEVFVRVLADNDSPLEGLSFSGAWASGLGYRRMSIEGTELGPDALAAEYVDMVEEPDHFGIAVIVDFPDLARTLPPGSDYYLLAVFFTIEPGLPPGTNLAVDLLESPAPISPVFTVEGKTVVPQLTAGVVTIKSLPVSPPELNAVTPSVGPVTGGTFITIEGNNLTPDTEAFVGGAPLVSRQVVSLTALTGNVPPSAAGPVDITVTNAAGTATLPDAFTYLEPPTIAAVTPNLGLGDVAVTITGTHFTDANDMQVLFDGSPAADLAVWSSTELTCRVPACSEETRWLSITVRTSGGEATEPQGYRCEATTFRRGDANCDSSLDLADAVWILSYLFRDSITPNCRDAMDSNDDGSVDIADAIYILAYLFRPAGVPPLPPFPGPGSDPTPDGLDCAVQCGTWP